MNVVCSFSTTKAQHLGFGLVECLISLMILSTSILMVMNVCLLQIKQARESLILNQLDQQVDSLCLFLYQHEKNANTIIANWRNQLSILFPDAKSQIKHLTNETVIEIDIHSYTIKVTAHGMRTKKTLTRNDAG